jgi:hypothetical protein
MGNSSPKKPCNLCSFFWKLLPTLDFDPVLLAFVVILATDGRLSSPKNGPSGESDRPDLPDPGRNDGDSCAVPSLESPWKLPGNVPGVVTVDPFEEDHAVTGACGETGGSRGAEDMLAEPGPSRATPSSRRWLPKMLMLWEVVLGEMFGEGEDGR